MTDFTAGRFLPFDSAEKYQRARSMSWMLQSTNMPPENSA
jgi:hypothetical protein